jgi:chorismate mutase
MMLRGIRGATTVDADSSEAILEATEELLLEIVEHNAIDLANVASILFTVTPDLSAQFPAAAARRLGWLTVPLLNFTEIGVRGGLPRCVRVLLHVNTELAQHEIVHIYLREAKALRPDLAAEKPT